MKKICFLLSAIFTLTARAQTADNASREQTMLPTELNIWQPQIYDVLRHYARTNVNEGVREEAGAAVKTQRQKFLPTISAGFNINRDKTSFFNNDQEKYSQSPATDLQLNVTLRQNLYNGGSDSGKLALSDKKLLLSELRLTHGTRRHVRAWLKDVAAILHQQRILSYHSNAVARATALNKLAKRKESSGFLGKRDLLDSERELLRTEQENISAQNTLKEVTERHRLFFGIAAPAGISVKNFESLHQTKISAAPSANVQPYVQSLLPVVISDLEKRIADEELKISSSGRFTPRLDAVAQTGKGYKLDGQPQQILTTSGAAFGKTDSTRSWSIGLTGELTLNPSVSFGLVEESRLRLSTSQKSNTKIVEDNTLALSNSLLRLEQVRARKRSFESLVAITTQLRDKNQRLFEAGEISIDRLIASEQDLNRDKISLAVIDLEDLKLTIDLSLSELWGLEPSSAAAQGEQ
jgi:outer membrane protein TolC